MTPIKESKCHQILPFLPTDLWFLVLWSMENAHSVLPSKDVDPSTARVGEIVHGRWKEKGRVTWLEAEVVAVGMCYCVEL